MHINILVSSQTCQFCFVNDSFYCIIFKIIETLRFNAIRASVDHLFGPGKAIGTFEKWAPGFDLKMCSRAQKVTGSFEKQAPEQEFRINTETSNYRLYATRAKCKKQIRELQRIKIMK